MANLKSAETLLVAPDPADKRLVQSVRGWDELGREIDVNVVVERALTLFLNGREIVTLMTIGDYPEYLGIGYLLNQAMLRPQDKIEAVDVDDELGVISIRTTALTDFEEKLRKKTITSGCAQGTAFGDLMDSLEEIVLDANAILHSSWLRSLSRKINQQPSLYLAAGAIHSCVLCQEDSPLIYMEDVGRHNAIDKIAGYMYRHSLSPQDKIFYTTGRLTSEMVIKSWRMGIPILVSRSGFTAAGVELARRAGMTLIGRAKGERFVVLSGRERLIDDHDQQASFFMPDHSGHER